MELIQVKNVSKAFGKVTILNDINFSLYKGEIIGLIGPSGSGKTTLIKCMMGMEMVSKGAVQIFGTAQYSRQTLARIGYMAQSDALYEELTGYENLTFFAKLFEFKKDVIAKRLEYVAKVVGLEKHLSKRVQHYSGGMKRRLSLAITLIHDPDILILDEPTVGIDPYLRLQIWNELEQLRVKGKAIIITTHVMDEAERCDKLALIRAGKLIANGQPKALKQELNVSTIEEIFLITGREN